jgi:tRNA(Ile)-lysidine synthase
MLRAGDKVLAAVSGGPDSVFLVHILKYLERRLGIGLYIAHMDHGVRGRESGRDARFVRKLAKSLKVKAVHKKLISIKNTASPFSLEERLREKRYEFLKATASRLKCRLVATGHTLDDQAETVLMRIIKGASLKGIIGIHPVRRDGRIRFIRPLIEIEKKDIIGYLKTRRLPFMVDRTNLENRFLRNKIRNRILPYLARINPRVKRALFNLSDSMREDYDFIEEEKKKIKPIRKGKKSARYILLRDLVLQPKALQKEIAREALKEAGGNIKKLTFRHWRDIDSLIRTKQKGKSLDLPGGVKIRKARDRIIFLRF